MYMCNRGKHKKNIVKRMTLATVNTMPFILNQAGSLNFNSLMKRDKVFTFAISTLWGSFVVVCSPSYIRITFDEQDI